MAENDRNFWNSGQLLSPKELLLLERIPCAAYLVQNDSDFTFLFGNQQFYHLFDSNPAEIKFKYGNRFSALIDPASFRFIRDALQAGTEQATPFQCEHRIVRRLQGETWLHTKILRQEFPWGSALFCTSSNITHYKRIEQSLLDYQELSHIISLQTHIEVFEYDLRTQTARLYTAHAFLTQLAPEDQGDGKTFQDAISARGILLDGYEAPFREAFTALERDGNRTVCELRMKNNTGGTSWVLFTLVPKKSRAHGKHRAIGILEDITQHKQASLNYLTETQFYQAMLSEKDAFAQIDVDADRITRIGGVWNLYNELIGKITYSALIEQFINTVVHPEDRRYYLEIMQRENLIASLNSGVNRLGCEFRRIMEQNKMVWMELNVHLFRDPFSQHILALCTILNIDTRKKQELSLLYETERDHLTNIYNKKMAETMVCETLAEARRDETCAFIILDLDNFKRINDTYGHKAGDKALVRLAEILSSAFRRYDIIGRFGGDEFILFLQNIGSEDKVRSRLLALYAQIHKEQQPPLSCSMGITLVHGGDSYERVFQQADAALYSAKKAGKDRFAFYAGDASDAAPVLPPRASQPDAQDETLPWADESAALGDPFDTFLSSQGDMAYLIDPNTFALLRGNQAFYDRIGMTPIQCTGMKCYELLHKRRTPCPFCSKANWTSDRFYLWRDHNDILEQEFLIKNKLVKWQGREVVLVLSVDISNNKSIADSLDNGAMEGHSILSGAQRMSAAADLTEAMASALETIGTFYRADAVLYWARRPENQGYTCRYSWSKKNQSLLSKDARSIAAVDAWLSSRQWSEPLLIESQEAMLCYSFELYQLMQRNHIVNERWFPLFDGHRELGCLSIENSTINLQNIAFMESFSTFITNELVKRSMIESILYASSHDDLTDLLSRSSYEQYSHNFNSDEHQSLGVLVANINDLKGINSAHGFSIGDSFIKHFASILKSIFSEHAVFRLNGDEFLVIAPDIEQDTLETRATNVQRKINQNGQYTVSIGYSWDNVELDLALLISQSTQSMQVNKKLFHDAGHSCSDVTRHKMLRELIHAIENRHFEVFLQPKVDFDKHTLIGAEALIRYRDEKLGVIPPAKFIDTLEKNNFVRYIDLFVFEEVCRLLQKWKQQGVSSPVISLNFSRLTLLEHDLLTSVERVISRYDVSRRNIEIEITESFADIGKSILSQVARDLYRAGFSIALDDFGTKYTNLSILSAIDFHMLKLDKSLINSLVDQKSNQIILKNIIVMCSDLNIDVIAEGVETQAQQELLRKLGCKLGQGYLYGKPMPISEFEQKYILSQK